MTYAKPGGGDMNPVPSAKIQRKRLSEELTVQLREHITAHGLRPGDALLTEQQMMARFGVSRSVVREATKALDFLGIIDAVPSRGMVLDEFDFDRASEYFGFHFALSNYPKEQLLRARAVIETGSLFSDVEAMKKDAEVYTLLRKCAAEGPAHDRPSDEQWIAYDIAFHRALVGASGIAPLASFCDLLEAFFQKVRGTVPSNPHVTDMHVEIVEALRMARLDTAVDLLRSHFRCYEENTNR
jgi:GntR family transcriptional regulator, transcriptional repressor for pyruvate dehydrogenase complex